MSGSRRRVNGHGLSAEICLLELDELGADELT